MNPLFSLIKFSEGVRGEGGWDLLKTLMMKKHVSTNERKKHQENPCGISVMYFKFSDSN